MSGEDARGGLLGALAARRDEFRLAVMFFTRLPVGAIARAPPLAAATWAFPIAGALHGLVVGIAFVAAIVAGLSPLVAAVLATALGVVASGAFHEDGLADFADGIGGGMTAERKLAIMRDSRIGTYGTLALILAIGLRATLIAELGSALALAVIGALAGLGALTRGLLPLLLVVLPPARSDGVAATESRNMSAGLAATAIVIAVAIAVAFIPAAPLVIGATCFAVAVVGWIAYRHVNGVTGDVLGAAQVIGEIAGLIALAAVW